MVDFGRKLKALRKQKKLTQEQLSSWVGLTKSVISAYESGTRYPSYEVLIKLANIFSVSTDYLLGIKPRQVIDITGLSAENARIVSELVDALKEKEN